VVPRRAVLYLASVTTASDPRPAVPLPSLPTKQPGPCALVLFGATGDLAQRKIIPALYQLALAKALPEGFALVGFSRSATDDESLRRKLRASLERFSRTKPVNQDLWRWFAERIYAVPGDVDVPEDFDRLARRLEEIDRLRGTQGNHLFYFATPASAYSDLFRNLRKSGLTKARRPNVDPWARVIVEKPFGRDLESAKELNRLARTSLDELQIYRIDHYLGKETVQNILVFRFGNAIFEPLWNRSHIDHVQITMAESIGVEGRGAFYEETGVLRDIVQNHLLQVLALCAMEPPVDFGPYEIRNMKSQVLRSLRRLHPCDIDQSVVWGQYDGYRQEPGVASDSRTPTFVALRAHVDNWRWNGVPFYLRAGKGLKARTTEVSLQFRHIPACLFGDEQVCRMIAPNVLTIRIQPDEGIALHIASKVPGEGQGIGGVTMDFSYADTFRKDPPEAYERLILDCLRGDPTLFARRDEVEFSWEFCDPLLESWAEPATPVDTYPRGSQGPERARELLRSDGRRWRAME